MSNSEQSNKGFDKSAYQRDYMARKRAEEKLKRQSEEDRVGEVSLASVEKESVVQTDVSRIEMESQEEEVKRDFIHTPTDAQYEALSPGYWIYGEEVKERKCWQCGKHYETRLELNKFCGPKCKEKWLSDAFGKLKGVKP
jgi:hypothetical protein